MALVDGSGWRRDYRRFLPDRSRVAMLPAHRSLPNLGAGERLMADQLAAPALAHSLRGLGYRTCLGDRHAACDHQPVRDAVRA
jgi:hypothetical protein